MKWYLSYIFACGLLLNIGSIKGAESSKERCLVIKKFALLGTGIFPEGETYKIFIKDVPKFVSLTKQKSANSHSLKIDSKFLQYATEEDPLVIILNNITIKRKYEDGYKTRSAVGITKLKIAVIGSQEVREKKLAKAIEQETISFMSIYAKTIPRGRPPYGFTFKIGDKQLKTTMFQFENGREKKYQVLINYSDHGDFVRLNQG